MKFLILLLISVNSFAGVIGMGLNEVPTNGMLGTMAKQDVANYPSLASTTWASLPSASAVAAYRVKYFVTDFPGGAQEVYSDGTNWKTVNQSLAAFTREASSPSTNLTSEVIMKNFLFPSGFFKVGDFVSLTVQISKDNTSNAQSANVRIGTAGTTADTLLFSTATALSSSSMNAHYTVVNLYIASATTVEVTQSAVSTLTTTTRVITIPNISNALYLDLGMNNATNTTTTFHLKGYSLTVIK